MSSLTTKNKQKTILIAEDDEEDRMLLEEAFEEVQFTHQLRFVHDGEEVFDYLNNRGRFEVPGGNPLPGLIVLDLNMPRKDGREVLEILNSTNDFRHIPVVVMTTSSAHEDIRFAYQHGGSSYITKPTHFRDLLESVKSLNRYWFNTVVLPGEKFPY